MAATNSVNFTLWRIPTGHVSNSCPFPQVNPMRQWHISHGRGPDASRMPCATMILSPKAGRDRHRTRLRRSPGFQMQGSRTYASPTSNILPSDSATVLTVITWSSNLAFTLTTSQSDRSVPFAGNAAMLASTYHAEGPSPLLLSAWLRLLRRRCRTPRRSRSTH